MNIRSLRLINFRNITQTEIIFGDQLNLIEGANGSGKTSLLEAVYFLGNGKSFRESQAKNLIKKPLSDFGLSAVFASGQLSHKLRIRRSEFRASVEFDEKKIKHSSGLALRFPIQLIHPESQELVSGGPKEKRKYLDWGLFHVEHRFVSVWNDYQKALKNRNAALSNHANESEVKAWDKELIRNGLIIHEYRIKYLKRLKPLIEQYLEKLVGIFQIDFVYQPGWKEDLSYTQALDRNYNQDRKLQRTGVGPHRADLAFFINGIELQKWCSRGQQKLVAASLLIAQLMYLKEELGKTCLLMIDDLPAELDQENRQRFLTCIKGLKVQTIITAVSEDLVDELLKEAKLFHVEHGEIMKERTNAIMPDR